MVELYIMTELLAGDALLPIEVVVVAAVEVRVVELRVARRDVAVRIDADTGNSEPTGEAYSRLQIRTLPLPPLHRRRTRLAVEPMGSSTMFRTDEPDQSETASVT